MHLHSDMFSGAGIKSFKGIDQRNRNNRAFSLGSCLKAAAFKCSWMISILASCSLRENQIIPSCRSPAWTASGLLCQ